MKTKTPARRPSSKVPFYELPDGQSYPSVTAVCRRASEIRQLREGPYARGEKIGVASAYHAISLLVFGRPAQPGDPFWSQACRYISVYEVAAETSEYLAQALDDLQIEGFKAPRTRTVYIVPDSQNMAETVRRWVHDKRQIKHAEDREFSKWFFGEFKEQKRRSR